MRLLLELADKWMMMQTGNVGRVTMISKMPEPADSWEGTYDATFYRPTCVFSSMLNHEVMGDEDCLYLNVHTQLLDKDARKAVMVWFHGGGFNSAIENHLFGPDFLLEKDVVLVTLNYRVGVIGAYVSSRRYRSLRSP
jgi:carboxylesterase type B